VDVASGLETPLKLLIGVCAGENVALRLFVDVQIADRQNFEIQIVGIKT
jgi:hypothetical protein